MKFIIRNFCTFDKFLHYAFMYRNDLGAQRVFLNIKERDHFTRFSL